MVESFLFSCPSWVWRSDTRGGGDFVGLIGCFLRVCVACVRACVCVCVCVCVFACVCAWLVSACHFVFCHRLELTVTSVLDAAPTPLGRSSHPQNVIPKRLKPRHAIPPTCRSLSVVCRFHSFFSWMMCASWSRSERVRPRSSQSQLPTIHTSIVPLRSLHIREHRCKTHTQDTDIKNHKQTNKQTNNQTRRRQASMRGGIVLMSSHAQQTSAGSGSGDGGGGGTREDVAYRPSSSPVSKPDTTSRSSPSSQPSPPDPPPPLPLLPPPPLAPAFRRWPPICRVMMRSWDTKRAEENKAGGEEEAQKTTNGAKGKRRTKHKGNQSTHSDARRCAVDKESKAKNGHGCALARGGSSEAGGPRKNRAGEQTAAHVPCGSFG